MSSLYNYENCSKKLHFLFNSNRRNEEIIHHIRNYNFHIKNTKDEKWITENRLISTKSDKNINWNPDQEKLCILSLKEPVNSTM